MAAELYLTDGETRIDLLGANRHATGIAVGRMTLSRVQRNPSGIFRQTYGSVTETYDLKITDYTQDLVAARQQALDRMLEKAENYFTSNVENQVVYLVMRGNGETNPRYALVYSGRIEAYDDIFDQPFAGPGKVTIDELVLGIERTTWQANPPTAPVCLPLENRVEWNPNSAAWSTSRTLNNVQSLFLTSTGVIIAGAATIERSTDSGGAWTSELSPGAANLRFWQFAQRGTRIWAAAGVTTGSAVSASGIYYSDNYGDTWTQHTSLADFYSVVYRASDDTLFFGGDGEVRYIRAGGALTMLSLDPVETIKAMVETSTGAVVLGDEFTTWRIPPNSLTLEATTSEAVGPFLAAVNTGDYLLMGTATSLSISRDDGATWDIYWRDWGIDTLYRLDNGGILASASATTNTYLSVDGGFTWITFPNSGFTQPVRAFLEKGDDYVYAGAANTIYRRIATDNTIAYGPFEPDCDTPAYVANHSLEANWTNAFVYDSSAATYTAITPVQVQAATEDNDSLLMFPSPIGTGDTFYLGVNSVVMANAAFTNFFVDLAQPNYTLTLVYEYWNGSAWTALTTATFRDNTQQMKKSGVVAWHIPDTSAFAATTVNSVNAYWIRVRVTALGTQTTLIPRFRNLYLVNKPYVEFRNISGDIPALGQLKLWNRLDNGPSPLLSQPTSRIVAGLRSLERGPRFNAYLNLAATQNQPGVTVTPVSPAAYATNTAIAAAGQYVTDTITLLNFWQSAVYVTLDGELAKDYAGTYQVFVRYAFYGATDAVKMRLSLEDIAFQVPIVGPETVAQFVGIETDFAWLAHLGQFTISPDRYLSGSDRNESTRLVLEVYSSSASQTLQLFELILVPADEWIGEFNGQDNWSYARVNEYIDIDSATFPKRVLRSLTRRNGTDQVSGIWQSSASGPLQLQPAIRQRLWFLAESHNTEENYEPSPHTLVHQAKLWHHARWVGLRGKD